MRIIVLRNYGGSRTQERRILPGEYDSEDAALFGLADYLVENGHAVIVEGLSDKIINVVQAATPVVKKAIVDMLSKSPEEAQEKVAEDDAVYTVGEGKHLDLSEEQHQAIVDITSEAIEAQEVFPDEAPEDKPPKRKRGKQ